MHYVDNFVGFLVSDNKFWKKIHVVLLISIDRARQLIMKLCDMRGQRLYL